MAEKYTKLFSINENLYCVGSPVLIQAGSLLKNNETGNVLGQFKFMNLTSKIIKAVLVQLDAFDISGRQLDGVYEFQYLDFYAGRDASFGQNTAVPLPEAVTRSIQIRCTSVIFDDGSSWYAPEGATWSPLPKQQYLSDIMETSLVAQYQRDTCPNATFLPLEYEDLWLCACNKINHRDEVCCHGCRNTKVVLTEALDKEKLAMHYAEYITHQQAIEAEETKRKAENARKTKKKAIIGAIAVIAAFVVLLFTVILPKQNANRQQELINRFKTESYSSICDVLESNSGIRALASDSEIREMINTMEISYKDEQILGDMYSGIAVYRLKLSSDYYMTYEMKLTADLSTGSGKMELIDYYTS